jgi:hypothetical protein
MTLLQKIIRATLLLSVLALNLVSVRAAAPTSVEKWGVFEIELKGPSEGNPFLDVTLSADFSNGVRTINVPGFYDGDGVNRIRYMPEETGSWTYFTRSNRWPLTQQRGSFTVTAPSKNNHGPVRVANTYHFAYADGTPYKQVGTTIYNWIDTPEAIQEQTLKTLAAAPFNKARMLITQQPTPYQKNFAPPRWPYAGKPPQDWDFTRFNPEFFRHYEKRIAQLRDLGIEADLVLFNPYGKFGFETLDAAGDERFVRYVIARFGAFRNVWWSLANEYDFLRTKTEPEWNRIGEIVKECDPFNHLRSIHNGKEIFDHNKTWITHVSMQNGAAVQEAGRAQMYRDTWRKPVVYDEVCYEGNSPYRWAQLTGPQMVHAFWCGTVAGTYVGHGDYFATVVEDTWTSFGGKMSGESWTRLAFLRKILEDSPATGIEPIDKWWTVGMGGNPGEYYLVYFGYDKPTTWKFELYRDGLADGNQFKVEILDTWNMSITPVEGVFTAKKKDNYTFVDDQGRSVKLPGQPNLALRIRRVSGVTGEISDKPPGN